MEKKKKKTNGHFAKHHNDDDDEPTLESQSNHAKINPNISGLATSFAFDGIFSPISSVDTPIGTFALTTHVPHYKCSSRLSHS